MICYNCNNIHDCSTFRSLYSMSNNFSINDCKGYNEASQYKYRRIAEHDDLMHLIYDYFTGQIKDYSDDEVKRAITLAISNL